MKNLKIAALLAMGVSMAVTGAYAIPAAYSNGDVLLGFEKSGSTNNLVIDLGTRDSFTNNFATLNLNISSDLTTAFGSSYANGTVLYGLVSGNTDDSSLWGSTIPANDAAYSSGTVGSPGGQAQPAADIFGVGSIYNNIRSGNTNVGTIGTTGMIFSPVTGTYTWTSMNQGANSSAPFEFFPGSIETTLSAGHKLDLYFFDCNNVGFGGNATPLNSPITVTTNGIVQSANAVPEPSTYALFGAGLIGLMVLYRRRLNS